MLHFDISLGRMVHGSMPTLHTLNPHQRAFFRPFPLPTFSPRLRSHTCLTYPCRTPAGGALAARNNGTNGSAPQGRRREIIPRAKRAPPRDSRTSARLRSRPIIPPVACVLLMGERTRRDRQRGWEGRTRGIGRGEAPNPNGTAAFSPPHLRCFRPF
jgi:hypothetical protein